MADLSGSGAVCLRPRGCASAALLSAVVRVARRTHSCGYIAAYSVQSAGLGFCRDEQPSSPRSCAVANGARQWLTAEIEAQASRKGPSALRGAEPSSQQPRN